MEGRRRAQGKGGKDAGERQRSHSPSSHHPHSASPSSSGGHHHYHHSHSHPRSHQRQHDHHAVRRRPKTWGLFEWRTATPPPCPKDQDPRYGWYYWDTDGKTILRGRVHEWAFYLFPAPALAYLRECGGDERALVSGCVMAACYLGCFGASALYHRADFPTLQVEMFYQKLDHAAIFTMIAGSYTPAGVLLAPGGSLAFVGLVWAGCVMGLAMTFAAGEWKTPPVAAAIYVLYGVSVGIASLQIVHKLSDRDVVIAYLGGASYILGAAVYAMQKPDPWKYVFGYHEIFHLLVVLGAAFTYLFNLSVLREYKELT